MKPRRIAILTPIFPFPLDSGSKLRIYQLARALYQHGFELYLICFDPFAAEHPNKDLSSIFEEVLIIQPLSAPPKNFSRAKWMQLVKGIPFTPNYILSEKIHAAIRQYQPHCLQIEKSISAAYVDISGLRKDGVKVVLEECCVHHLAYEREASIQNSVLQRFLYFLRAKRLKRFESKLAGSADAITAVSREEARVLKALNPGTKVLLCPNGIDEEVVKKQLPPFHQRKPELFFCGDLSYKPNLDAVVQYALHVGPLLKIHGADIGLTVAGANPHLFWNQLPTIESKIRFLGYIPNVEPYFEECRIFVNPMRLGGGTRMKMLHAMGHAMACVSTGIGAEGIEMEPDRDALIGNTMEKLAALLIRVINDPQKGADLAQSARNRVKNKYLWSQCTKNLIDYYSAN